MSACRLLIFDHKVNDLIRQTETNQMLDGYCGSSVLLVIVTTGWAFEGNCFIIRGRHGLSRDVIRRWKGHDTR